MSGPETRISSIVIARDEEDRIVPCLRSIVWVDQRIVVVDAATTDATAERARPLATEVLIQPWEGFSPAKRIALARSNHPWILWIDADEEVCPMLAAAIRKAVQDPGEHAAFRVRRRNHYLGRTIRHGGWAEDRVVRLFRRDRGTFDDKLVHEGVRIDGRIGELDGYLEHNSYRNLSHHMEKIRRFSALWAQQAMRDGRRACAADLILRPPLRFLRGYILKAGFLDGRAGLILAFMDAVYVGMKYACLLEAQTGAATDGPKEGGDAR